MNKASHLLFLFTAVYRLSALCQQKDDLFKQLKRADSLLFEVGFNQCNIPQMEKLLSENFEFYHDEAGITKSKAEFLTSVSNRVCKLNYRPKRVLDEESLDVYPLKRSDTLYGAVQTGLHRFYAFEENNSHRLTSVAKFVHVWLLENGTLKLSRGISYDHRNVTLEQYNSDGNLLFKDKVATERWLAKQNVPALGIGVIKNGKIEEIEVYGNLEKGVPAPRNTIWNVASLTKPITAMVALKLISSGKWSLDEPVYKYWVDPDVAADPRLKKLTTRYILSHQTGFPNWRYLKTDGKLAFDFEPGTKYQYSGEGFEYLRKAMESKFHTKLSKLADSLIFKPLGMNDTRYYWDKSVDETRFAKCHDSKGNVYPTYKNSTENGADDLLTTMEDYSKFVLHVMNGAGLKKELYKEMCREQVRVKSNKHWVLGWWVDENIGKGEYAMIHGGDDKGVHAFVMILPKSNQALLIFTNSDNGTDVFIPTILHYLGELGQGIVDVETK